MNKLELKHVAPYLPYGLRIEPIYKSMGHMGGFHRRELDINVLYERDIEDIKPILRPLSDLTKEIEHDGEKLVPYDTLRDMELNNMRLHSDGCLTINSRNIHNCEQWRIQKLLEWHFDVFGLIEKGLAIDINTL